MKKTQWLALLTALLLLLPLGATFAAQGDVNTPYKAPASAAGQSVYDLSVTLLGVTYPLPVAYKSLIKNGWAAGNVDADKSTLRGERYTTVTLRNGEEQIEVRVENPSKNVASLDECMVTQMTLIPKDCLFSIAGVTGDTTGAEVVARLGNPSANHGISDATRNSTLYYPGLTFLFDPDGVMLSACVERERIEPAYASTDAEKALLAGYAAPTSLGRKIKTPVFELLGKLYQLPAPVGAFIRNGWQVLSVDTEDDGRVPAKGRCTLQLYQGDYLLSLWVRNDGAKAANYYECPVYKVSHYCSYNVFESTLLSGGVQVGMTNAAFLALAGDEAGKPDDDSQHKVGETQTYSYYLSDTQSGVHLTLYFDTEDDTLRYFELWVN